MSPRAKIISMLTEMKDKGAKDMKVEEMVMSEYTKWVDDRVTELGFEIKTANSDIEKLVAFIEKSESDVARLGSSIRKLDGEIGEMDASKAAGKKQRAFLSLAGSCSSAGGARLAARRWPLAGDDLLREPLQRSRLCRPRQPFRLFGRRFCRRKPLRLAHNALQHGLEECLKLGGL